MKAQQQLTITPEEARAISKEAYIYGFPLVDSYRILYSYFVDRSDPEYKAGWNENVFNNARVFPSFGPRCAVGLLQGLCSS